MLPTPCWRDSMSVVIIASILGQDRAIFVWPWKMVSVSVRYLFYQPVDEKIKTWTLRFPAKENSNMEKVLLDWPFVLQHDVKAKYRLISRKFSGMTVFHPSVRLTINNQPKATRVCIRSINQSNRSFSVRLLFLFCSPVFISRSCENRPIKRCLFTFSFKPIERTSVTSRYHSSKISGSQ